MEDKTMKTYEELQDLAICYGYKLLEKAKEKYSDEESLEQNFYHKIIVFDDESIVELEDPNKPVPPELHEGMGFEIFYYLGKHRVGMFYCPGVGEWNDEIEDFEDRWNDEKECWE